MHSFQNIPKLLRNIWATFARNFIPKNFKKSPNLVTLDISVDAKTTPLCFYKWFAHRDRSVGANHTISMVPIGSAVFGVLWFSMFCVYWVNYPSQWRNSWMRIPVSFERNCNRLHPWSCCWIYLFPQHSVTIGES